MIRAQGITQAVIASGAKPEDWPRLARYGMRVANFLAQRLNGENVPPPTMEKASGQTKQRKG